MTKHHTAYPHYFIFDGVGAVDGEMFSDYESLLGSVGWHDMPDYVVKAFDTKTNEMADVTEAVAHDWWFSSWNDSFEKVRAGKSGFCFLARFFIREIEQFEAELHAEANAADRWHDEMAAAE